MPTRYFPTWAEFRQALEPELALFRGRPKLWAICGALTFIPSVYAVTYLSSVWDPYGQMNKLPVALVNQDQGTTVRGQAINVGRQVADSLLKRRPVDFELLESADAARAAIAQGKDYFALVIPPDFSRRAIAQDTLGHADLVLISSSGTSFMASAIGKRVASEVAANVTEELQEKRWTVVSEQLGKLKQGVGQLRDGSHRLNAGLGTLADGAGQLDAGLAKANDGGKRLTQGAQALSGGVDKLTGGMGQLKGGIHLMATKLPADSDLDRLAAGSRQLASGASDLSAGLGQLDAGGTSLASGSAQLAGGLDQLKAGSAQLVAGSHELTSGVGKVPIVGGQLAAGAGKLEAGIAQLNQGIGQANEGSHRLADGAKQLSTGLHQAREGGDRVASGAAQLDGGVQRLTGGVKQLGGGIRMMDARMPADQDLEKLSNGATQLASGAGTLSGGLGRLADGGHRLADGAVQARDGGAKLAAGLDTLYSRLPATAPAEHGTLKAAVTVAEEQIAPATTNGAAFSPYFIALSLWMGAVMTTFVFHFILLAESVRPVGQRARMLAKGVVPAVLVLLQAFVLTVILDVGMQLPVPNPLAFFAINAAGSLTFLAIVMALIMILGDAGKIVAVILLIFQLGAAGGAYPIQLAPPFFQWVHPLLPVTNLVKALRATLFGAYQGVWWKPAGELALAGLLAWWVTIALGRRRWKYTPDDQYSTVLDL